MQGAGKKNMEHKPDWRVVAPAEGTRNIKEPKP
jgi:hypothetical protein